MKTDIAKVALSYRHPRNRKKTSISIKCAMEVDDNAPRKTLLQMSKTVTNAQFGK